LAKAVARCPVYFLLLRYASDRVGKGSGGQFCPPSGSAIASNSIPSPRQDRSDNFVHASAFLCHPANDGRRLLAPYTGEQTVLAQEFPECPPVLLHRPSGPT